MICRFPVQLSVDIHGKKGSIYVPCGKCAWCLRQKRNEWFVRFLEESKQHDFVRFLTLDYDDDHLPVKTDETTGEIIPVVSLRDIQLYHKRIRKAGYKFRFFVASEYGPKGGRPHCHGIYWSDEKIPYYDFWKNGDEGADVPASPASFKYVTKYILKGSNVPPGADDNFHVMSRKPGLGAAFMSNMDADTPFYRYYDKKMKLPSYYVRKALDLLPDDLKAAYKESKLDYLASIPKHAALLELYQKSGSHYEFEKWLWDLYGIDFNRQISINNK